MPKPQLKNIEEHLQFLVGERNPFTEPDHLEKIRLYITKQFESFNLSVNQEAVDFENSRSFNITGKPTGTQSTPFVLAAHIARCLADHTFHTPMIFSAFTLEKYGFIGSRYFIEKAVTRNETFSSMISLEMLGYKTNAKSHERNETACPFPKSRYPCSSGNRRKLQ